MIDKRSFAIGARSSIAKGGGSGTSDYEALSNKPSIGGITLSGNKTAADLGLVEAASGKGLSTNDFTDERKTKLDGMEAQANKTLIDDTLSNAGQAADAKASGDAIDSLQTETALLRELIDGIDAPIYRTVGPGNPVVFTDGADANVKTLTVELTPTQSGSGDPYPPGDGKNLLPQTVTTATAVNTRDGSGTVTFTPLGDGRWKAARDAGATSYAQLTFAAKIPIENTAFQIGGDYILSGTPSDAVSDTSIVFLGYASDGSTLTLSKRNTAASQEVSFTIPDGTAFISVYFHYDANQSGEITYSPMVRRASETDSAFAPYANIRPITGVSSVSVTGSGKNLLVNNWAGTLSVYGITINFNSDGSLTLNGTTNSTAIPVPNFAIDHGGFGTQATKANPILPGTYKLYIGNAYENAPRLQVLSWSDDKSTSKQLLTSPHGTFTVSDSDTFVTVRLWIASGWKYDNLTIYPMICRVDDDETAFEPYPRSVTVSTGDAGTVYGGTLNVTTGELTVTHQCLDLDTLTWGYNTKSKYGYVASGLANFGQDPVSFSGTPYLSSHFQYGHAYFGNVMALYVNSSNLSSTTHTLYLPHAEALGIGSAEELQSWFTAQRDAGTPVQVYAELKQPLTYQLTGQDLATFSGSNTVFTDAGSVTVRYRADPTLAYEELENSLTNAILSLGANF